MSDQDLESASPWLLKSADPSAVQSLAAKLGCALPIAQILASRGVDTPAAAEAFLNPTLESFLDSPANDPTQMLGMATAVGRVLAAIRAGEPMLIYGDYDVDGTTATVLLKTTIERVGLAMEPPRRLRWNLPSIARRPATVV